MTPAVGRVFMPLMPRAWNIAPPHENARTLAAQWGVAPLTAQVLLNRGIESADDVRRFLKPSLADLHPPEATFGVTNAAARIATAIRNQQKIVLYGDYDVDGITGVAILWHCLALAGATPDFYIPHRLEEGYGLNSEALEKLAADGAQLVITVDCGITAIESARRARQLGLDLIITDHHEPQRNAAGGTQLPDAAAIVHSGLGENPVNRDLCGAGVALKLAWAVAQELCGTKKVSPQFRDFLLTATSLAALGTVADVVSLTAENRILALHGLRGLPACTQPGIKALIETAGLTGQKLDGYDVGFKLAPRLNAIGRMGHARLAVELLTRASPDDALKIAQNLEQQNRARQTLERRITAEAKQMVLDRQLASDGSRAIVLASEGWHAGVIGVVASRLVDEFQRPTVLIALDNGIGQGSARGIRHFPLHEALSACGQHLLTWGGHAMAAGLRIARDRVDAFTEAFAARAAQCLTPGDLQPQLRIDALANIAELVEPLMLDLARLEPHGAGNPSPRFATDWLDLVGEPRVVGAGGDHLQFTLAGGGLQRKAIAFGQAKMKDGLCSARRCRVAFQPILNEWNGRRNVEMQIADIQLHG